MRPFGKTAANGLLAAVVLFPGLGCASGKSEPSARAAQPTREVLPGIRLDPDAKIISVDGAVCLEKGILEYVAVAGGGKEYESIFRLNCQPKHLQQVMLMAGYEIGTVAPEARGDFAPGSDPESLQRPNGAPETAQPPEEYWRKDATRPSYVAIDVEVQTPDGTWQRRPIASFLKDRRTGQPPRGLHWAFTGSYFFRTHPDNPQIFAADNTKSVIGLWYDAAALLNLCQDVGNPYRGAAAGLEVDPDRIPPKDTPVRIILRPSELGRRP